MAKYPEEEERVIADIKEEKDDFQDAKHLFKKIDANILDIDQYGEVQEKYYAGNHVSCFMDSAKIDELTSINFSAVTDDGPAYSYNSKLWNTLVPGKFKVVGSFSINFTKSGYLFDLLNQSDIRMDRNRGEIIDKKREIEKLKRSNRKVEDEREKFRKLYWGVNADDGKSDEELLKIDINKVKRRTFTLSLLYGNLEDPLGRNTLHRISHVKIVKVEQSIAQDGTPIQEVYTFIARTLDDPSEILEEVKFRPAEIKLDEAAKKEILIKFLRQIGRKLFTYLTDPDTVDVKLESVLSKPYLQDIPVLKMRRAGWDEKEEEELQEGATGFWAGIARFFTHDWLGIRPLFSRFVAPAFKALKGNSITSASVETVSGFYFRLKPRLAKGGLGDKYSGGEDLSSRKEIIGNTVLETLYNDNNYSDDSLTRSYGDLAWSVLMDRTPVAGKNKSPLSFNMDPYVVFDTVGISNGTKILGAFNLEYAFEGGDDERGYITMSIPQYDKWTKLKGQIGGMLAAATNMNSSRFKDEADKYKIDPQFGTIQVMSADGSISYADGEDFEINYGEGKINILSTGAIKGTNGNDLAPGGSDTIYVQDFKEGKRYVAGEYIRHENNVWQIRTGEELKTTTIGLEANIDAGDVVDSVRTADLRIYFQKDVFIFKRENATELSPEIYPDSFVPFGIDNTFYIKGTKEQREAQRTEALERLRTRRELMTNLALSNSRILAVDFDRGKISRRPDFNETIVLEGSRPNKMRVRVIEGAENSAVRSAKKQYKGGGPIAIKNAERARSKGEAKRVLERWGNSASFSNLLFLPFDDASRELFKEERDPFKPGTVPSIIKTIDDESSSENGFRIIDSTIADSCWIDITENQINECYLNGKQILLSIWAKGDNVRITEKGKEDEAEVLDTNKLRRAVDRGESKIIPILTAGSKKEEATKTVGENETLVKFYTYSAEFDGLDNWTSGQPYEKNQIVNYRGYLIKAERSNQKTVLDWDDWERYEPTQDDHVGKADLYKYDIKSVQLISTFEESGYTKYQYMIETDAPVGFDMKEIKKISVRAIPEASLVSAISSKQGRKLQFYNDFAEDPTARLDADQSVYYFIATTAHKPSSLVEGLTVDVIVPRILLYVTTMGYFFDYLSYIDNIAGKLVSVYGIGADAINIDFNFVRDAISDGWLLQEKEYGVSSNRSAGHNVIRDNKGVLVHKMFMNEPLSFDLVDYLNIAKSEQVETTDDEKDAPLKLLNSENYLTLMKAENSFEVTIIANVLYRHQYEYIREFFFENIVQKKYGDINYKIPGIALLLVDTNDEHNVLSGIGTQFTVDLYVGMKISFNGRDYTIDEILNDEEAIVEDDGNIEYSIESADPIYGTSVPKSMMSNMLLTPQDSPVELVDMEASTDAAGRPALRWNDALNPNRHILPASEFTFLEHNGRLMDTLGKFMRNIHDDVAKSSLIESVEEPYDEQLNRNLPPNELVAVSQNSLDFTFDYYSTAPRPTIVDEVNYSELSDTLFAGETETGEDAFARSIAQDILAKAVTYFPALTFDLLVTLQAIQGTSEHPDARAMDIAYFKKFASYTRLSYESDDKASRLLITIPLKMKVTQPGDIISYPDATIHNPPDGMAGPPNIIKAGLSSLMVQAIADYVPNMVLYVIAEYLMLKPELQGQYSSILQTIEVNTTDGKYDRLYFEIAVWKNVQALAGLFDIALTNYEAARLIHEAFAGMWAGHNEDGNTTRPADWNNQVINQGLPVDLNPAIDSVNITYSRKSLR